MRAGAMTESTLAVFFNPKRSIPPSPAARSALTCWTSVGWHGALYK